MSRANCLRTPIRKIAVRLSLRDRRRVFLDSAAGTTRPDRRDEKRDSSESNEPCCVDVMICEAKRIREFKVGATGGCFGLPPDGRQDLE